MGVGVGVRGCVGDKMKRTDFTRRAAVHLLSLIEVVAIADHGWLLAFLLTFNVFAVRSLTPHSPAAFSAVVMLATLIVVPVMVNLSESTFWFAHGLRTLNIPLWILPYAAIVAHWVLDAHCVITRFASRRTTHLP